MSNTADASAYGDHNNPFIVLGLDPRDSSLTLHAVQMHMRRKVNRHLYERGTPLMAQTRGPNVPRLAHANQAMQLIESWTGPYYDFHAGRRDYMAGNPQQLWNPLAPVGCIEATRPPPPPPTRSTATRHPPQAPPASSPIIDLDDYEDEEYDDDISSCISDGESPVPSRPDTYNRPFDVSDDEQPHSPPPSARSQPPFPPPKPRRQQHTKPTIRNPSRRRDGAPRATNPRSPPPRPTPYPPRAKPRSSTTRRRRLEPRGILLGKWWRSGLPRNGPRNAVYGSIDVQGRVNRRVNKEDGAGNVVMGGNYNGCNTACSHDDIEPLQQYEGKSKEEMDVVIRAAFHTV